ncbi:MAG: hypothetical protein ACRDRT_01820, partial [Pseudonocardiaceae bacterium]
MSPEKMEHLFLPPPDYENLTKGEGAYVRHGQSIGVDQRYKCRIRNPWYRTPYARVPDVIVPVFS